jgi:hypothetical protein
METVPYHKHTGIDSPKIHEEDLLSRTSLGDVPYISVTAGEAIAQDEVVCMKPNILEAFCTKSAYTRQGLSGISNTNYGSETLLESRQDSSDFVWISHLEFDMGDVPAVKDILKVELAIYVTVIYGSAPNFNISRITAPWNEGTVTHNTIPATSNDVDTVYSSDATFTVYDGGWQYIDITQLVSHWKDGAINNYGLGISCSSGVGTGIAFSSDDATNANNRPKLVIHRTVGNGTLGLANSNDYLTSRSIIGVAQNSAGEGSPVRVSYSLANIGGNGAIGSSFYLATTDGDITLAKSALARPIRLGTYLSASQSLLNIPNKDILVWAYSPNAQTARRFYVPDEVRYAMIYAFMDSATDEFWVVKANRNEVNDWRTHYNVNYTWGSNYLNITASTNYYIKHVYFYN